MSVCHTYLSALQFWAFIHNFRFQEFPSLGAIFSCFPLTIVKAHRCVCVCVFFLCMLQRIFAQIPKKIQSTEKNGYFFSWQIYLRPIIRRVNRLLSSQRSQSRRLIDENETEKKKVHLCLCHQYEMKLNEKRTENSFAIFARCCHSLLWFDCSFYLSISCCCRFSCVCVCRMWKTNPINISNWNSI